MKLVVMTPNRKAHLEALGRIVEAMSNVEFNIVLSFSIMSKIDLGVLQSMLAGESVGKVLSMLESVFIYKIKDEKLLNTFGKILQKLRDSITERNDTIHSVLYVTIKSRFIK